MTSTYTGHEKDYETNLTYMMARYYSQGYGRFLSPDPGYDYDQLDPMSWNLYSYVRGNPIRMIDRTGMSAEEVEEIIRAMHKLFMRSLQNTLSDSKNPLKRNERGRYIQRTPEGHIAPLWGEFEGTNNYVGFPSIPPNLIKTVIGMFHTHPNGSIFSIEDIISINELYKQTSKIKDSAIARYSILYTADNTIYAMELVGKVGFAEINLLQRKFKRLAGKYSQSSNQSSPEAVEAINKAMKEVFKSLKTKVILYQITVTEKDGKLLINVKVINR